MTGLGWDGFVHPAYPPRFTETKLTFKAGNRPTTRYESYVIGAGGFSFDMLQHDQCWPVTCDDAATLALTAHNERSIRMRSYQTPTVDRWSSFGWRCRAYW